MFSLVWPGGLVLMTEIGKGNKKERLSRRTTGPQKTNKEKSKNLLHSDALCDILPLVPQKGTVGVDGGEGTPVPIPNTAVKLTCAENTWLEAAREDKQMPTQIFLLSSVGRACGC